ncbi:MAG: hypothetical protein JWO30_2698 [Fibrobacteres bacterium]|nr:hypothetical protein [Fibrobacterota bacterium]
MAVRFFRACLPALLLSACLFETGSGNGGPPDTDGAGFPEISPDLAIGNQWMYRFRQYTEYQDGSRGDTTLYFIHYEITGDSLIAGIGYRILVEEDLALFNTDFGLVKNRSAYAVLAGSSGLQVKALKGGERATGRFPFKSSAGSGIDTLHFKDEVTALKMPLGAGKGWVYREPGNPDGTLAATKTFLAWDTISLAGAPTPALEFRVEVENLEYIRTLEWYAGDIKVFSRSSASTTFAGMDSSRSEEEYLGKRTFTRDDTLAVLKGTIFDPAAE